MSTTVFLTTASLIFGTILIVFAMKYASAVLAARAKLANDDDLRKLAQNAVATQSENQAALSAIRDELAKLGATVASVEKILKQVE
ncbi:MAG TPA: hypothetical protein VGH80_08180 [Xanthomonadaceae bacterium]|jgi:signal transduction histidine kinase